MKSMVDSRKSKVKSKSLSFCKWEDTSTPQFLTFAAPALFFPFRLQSIAESLQGGFPLSRE
jgi:preprotein translocase subunit SecB